MPILRLVRCVVLRNGPKRVLVRNLRHHKSHVASEESPSTFQEPTLEKPGEDD